jgi:putative ABC transport system permease protein
MKHAFRQLAKSPGYTAFAVLIVAIGIGAATAMFSAVNALVLRPIPLPEPERIVVVYETNLARDLPQFSSSIPNYADWKARSQSWESLAAVASRAMNLTGGAGTEPELVQVRTVTANFLPTLGLAPMRGRNFREEEDRPGGAKVAIISAAFWERRLGGAPDVLNQTLTLDGVAYTIIGVTPQGAVLPLELEIAIPLATDPAKVERMNHYIDVFGRLKRGVTLTQADAEMKTLAAQIFAELPQEDRGWSTRLVPLAQEVVGDGVRKGLYVLLGAVGVLLLIACANLSNLMLVRASARAHEIAIRTALGASRWRVIRQLVTESLLVTAVGGLAGVLLALWAIDALRALPLPRAVEISLDLRVLAAACATTLLTGLLAGAGPALKASQARPQEALKGRAPRSGHRSPLRDTMVVAQIALSLTLLVGAALLVRSFWRLLQVNPGFNSEGVVTLSLRPTGNAPRFYDQVHERVAALPGVASVGSISRLPLTAGSTQNNIFPVGPAAIPPGATVQANWRLIHGDYFSAMQIPLLRGRDFRGLPAPEARTSMVISVALARALWGDEDPIGREIDRAGGRFKVIGVVGDVRSQQLGVAPKATFYMSIHRFTYGPQTLAVRLAPSTSGAAAKPAPLGSLVTALRHTIRQIDPNVPIFQVQAMDELRADSLRQERIVITLLGGFAGVALLLSALGTYGVIAFTVQQRTVEIGIRLAIGAQAGDVLRLILGHGARLAALGIVLGVAGALAASRVLATQLYETSTHDLTSYALAAFALAAAALLAAWLPARRATRVDPIRALRSE